MSTFDLSTLELPIVQAPMAGGPSTPQLAIAVCDAGALGFLAAGYKRADAVRDEIHAVRAATAAPFGVNLFVPAEEPADREGVRRYLERLKPEAERQGAALGEPSFDDALYIALARRLDEPLATTDARLARAAAAVGVEIASPK